MFDANILIVEDDPIIQEILEETLKTAGYQSAVVDTVGAAWDQLTLSPQQFEVILLDRNLPDADGLELLKRIKADQDLMHLPVVMETAMNAVEDVHAGLQAGAYYYLTKPVDDAALLAIINVAIQSYRDYLQLQNEIRLKASALSQLSLAQFSFRTPKQARDIAVLLSSACPDAQKVVLGLSELMLNAIEHGNLGITYDEKSQLIQDERLQEEIELRLAQPDYANKTAIINFQKDGSKIRFLIQDQGDGFDWSKYLEISPDRVFDLHGRGIAMARLISFDQLEYHGMGNEVMAIIRI